MRASTRLATWLFGHRSRVACAALLAAAAGLAALRPADGSTGESAYERAGRLFKENNWAEARAQFDAARAEEADALSPRAVECVQRAAECSLQLAQWDDALRRATEFIAGSAGTLQEVRGERFLAGLYARLPHYGTKRGSTFLRGQWTQGVQVYCFRKDRAEAVRHSERARDLILALESSFGSAANPDTPGRRDEVRQERMSLNLDLASTISASSPYGWGGQLGMGWWWGRDDEEDSQALEDADYEEPRWRGWRQPTTPPTGIPTDADGNPAFIETPKQYAPTLGAGQKIRFLLAEVEEIDNTPNREYAATALLRWAMLARSLYGPDLETQWRNFGGQIDRLGRPISGEEKDAPARKIWELGDDEARTFVGGRLRIVTLPASESPIRLLRRVQEKYPASAVVAEAQYGLALYYQSRQQFPDALREHRAVIERFPKSSFAGESEKHVAMIEAPDAALGNTGVALPGEPPRLGFTYRNTARMEFRATPIDLLKLVQDEMETKPKDYWNYRTLPWNLFRDEKETWRKYLGPQKAAWTETIALPEGSRVAEGATLAPLAEPGAYVVEANPAGSKDISRTLVLVSDIAIVQKNLEGGLLIYAADARSGQPLPNKAIRVYEHWTRWDNGSHHVDFDQQTLSTDEQGVLVYRPRHADESPMIDAVVAGEGGRMALSFFQNWSRWYDTTQTSGSRFYVITDRPVYRPGQTVQFRGWLRTLANGQYQPPQTGWTVQVDVYDARNTLVRTLTPATDEFGGISGSLVLGREAALGMYHLRINSTYPDGAQLAGGTFRVEEYKRPEFSVSVKPAKSQARLGEKVRARIEAQYYFGAPVAKGEVTYKVFREDYHHVYFEPGEYDWLYGVGYGRCIYPYPWFGWWGRWGCYLDCRVGWPWWGSYVIGDGIRESYEPWSSTRKALRELVATGTAKLAADGSYEIEIDTAPAARELADRDHRYTIEADVRDESRRVISGAGGVTVARQSFFAFVETNMGWYQPAGEVHARVRTVSADNAPVATSGEVVVTRITYGGGDNREAQETELRRWAAQTDEQGRLDFRVPVPGEGQYRISFQAKDAWDGEVLGNALFWVCGPAFDGRAYRFNGIEIVADKRTYAVGDVAHLLINTAQSGSRVLLSDDALNGIWRNWRMLDVPQRTIVLDVPIESRHVPNFFVEATLVREGRVETEMRELFVPPVRELLNVAITTDKSVYRPGEKGVVEVAVTDASGEPATGQVTLTAFDESITYIQDELAPSPRAFFHGRRRTHTPSTSDSVQLVFYPYGELVRPEQAVAAYGVPDGWYGAWGLTQGGLAGRGGALREGIDSLKSEAGEANAPAAAPESEMSLDAASRSLGMPYGGGAGGRADADGTPDLVAPELRSNFAETAAWLPALTLDARGRAKAEIEFPDSLTSWRLRGYALSNATQVGDARADVTTTKRLLVRLQSPRFYVERDMVVLSTNVHNYLDRSKRVRVELLIPTDQLIPPAGRFAVGPPGKDGRLTLVQEVDVAGGGEARLDWPLAVAKQGLARVTARALSDEESDAVQLAFPVLVHGVSKTVVQSGSYRPEDAGQRVLSLDVPTEVDAGQTLLEITLSPSLAGAMVDALPYLIEYPYGCVEQTMSRFYPCVVTRGMLTRLGLNLEDIARQRAQLAAADAKHRFGPDHNPVFDSATMDRVIREGLDRIYTMQGSDGGWGWWKENESSPFQTAYVLQGLHAAREAGVSVDGGVYERGLNYLTSAIDAELSKPKEKRQLHDLATQAWMAYVLSLEKRLSSTDPLKSWATELFETREKLGNYGRALLALALHHDGQSERAALTLRNVLQFVEREDANETAWIRTPSEGWWYWWNNDIETNAWTLRALAALDPQSDVAPRIAKWLLNNRRNGYYWRSTRDTALVISAMADYMIASNEAAPDYSISLTLDGEPLRELHVSKDNLFAFENRIRLYGLQVPPGRHELTIAKSGTGALYYSAFVTYFSHEEDIRGAGHEILIHRDYFRLEPLPETVQLPDAGMTSTPPGLQPKPPGDTGRTELRDGYRRVRLSPGDQVRSGEKVEVVLTLTSRNVYDFLAFEDFKPAGFEAVEVRSGGRWAGGLCANVELRDEKTVFFLPLLEQGEHVLRYRLRAEAPGAFHALPTIGYAMYAPEVRAISDEMRLEIEDR